MPCWNSSSSSKNYSPSHKTRRGGNSELHLPHGERGRGVESSPYYQKNEIKSNSALPSVTRRLSPWWRVASGSSLRTLVTLPDSLPECSQELTLPRKASGTLPHEPVKNGNQQGARGRERPSGCERIGSESLPGRMTSSGIFFFFLSVLSLPLPPQISPSCKTLRCPELQHRSATF